MAETKIDTPLAELSVNTIRTLAMDAVQKANSGHPGAPMGLAPVAYVIWRHFLRFNPANPNWPGRDRFILSAGHASMLLYALLHLTGYEVSLNDLKNFRQLGSITPGHPESRDTPGVEVTTGPLGQGFANGVGMGIAERVLADCFNRPDHTLVDSHIYALCSDGDIMEGISSEAAQLAGHLGLGNLVYVYDANRISIEGSTDLALSENTADRFRAYEWHVQELGYEADLDGMAAAIEAARQERSRPSIIVLRTHIAFGSPHKQDTAAAHGEPLGEEEVKLTKQTLGWPDDKFFYIPDEVAEQMDSRQRGAMLEQQWNEQLAAYESDHPELAAEWRRWQSGEFPGDWNKDIPTFVPDDGPIATRSASGTVLNAIAPRLPELIGGSADLAPSTKTLIKDSPSIAPHEFSGRNLHFGVREHSMGAELNGIAAYSGLRPYGSTFLVFSDYMRPAIRLAALAGLPVIYVFTHDSIFLGEDGPTHQPVEHIASLRAMPNLCLIRPADANETAQAWECAIERRDGPTALVCTRQKLPVFEAGRVPADGVRKGAYVFEDCDGEPELILIATGSEVELARRASDRLRAGGIEARVVSMPSWELFEEQPASYRDEVLPPTVRARVAVEAAAGFGWERWVGELGRTVTVNRFGASAPYTELAEPYGLTQENVEKVAREVVASVSETPAP